MFAEAEASGEACYKGQTTGIRNMEDEHFCDLQYKGHGEQMLTTYKLLIRLPWGSKSLIFYGVLSYGAL